MAEEKENLQEEASQETVQEASAETASAETAETPAPEGKEEEVKEEVIEEMTTLHERTIAALSYVSFLAVVPFYLKKDSKFCRFHGKQGLLIAIIFFFGKLFMVLDLLMDLALILQFVIFVKMGFSALSGRWTKFPWIYARSCQLEEQLSLKTKEEEKEEAALKPNQVREESEEVADEEPEEPTEESKH